MFIKLNFMKKVVFIVLLFVFIGCKNEETKIIKTDDFELIIAKEQKGLLILFPEGGGSPENIKREFKIVEAAAKKGVSLLMVNFARKLWVEDEDCKNLSALIKSVIKEQKLKTDNIYIGGMSIGGNVTLSLSQYMLKKKMLPIKGVFIVDSPIDLYGLYESSVKDINNKTLSEERLSEPKWIVNYFEESFSKDSLLFNIQKTSPITLKTNNYSNISELKSKKLRFYIEPDIDWYENIRKTDFKSTNAYTIQQLYGLLKESNWDGVELIESKNKGYRSNGDRNPHSWSIINVDNLLNWIL